MTILAEPSFQRSADRPRSGGPLGKILVAAGWISEAHLAEALAVQAQTGARLGEVLAANGWASEEHVARALAHQHGLGYVDLVRDPPRREAARMADVEAFLRHRLLPLRIVDERQFYATAEPKTAAEALAALAPSGDAEVLVAGRRALDQAALDLYGPELAARAASRTPERFSVRGLDTGRFIFVVALAALTVWLAVEGKAGLVALGLMLLVLSTGTALVRLAAILSGIPFSPSSAPTSGAVVLADRRAPPRISILVPLYREASMVRRIIGALERIDYPRALLDVKLLLEGGDTATLRAVRARRLPGWITPLVLPGGMPRTKPRALNLALDFCRGEIIGILDAEDRPDPRQLREVAAHLRAAPPDVACVQCQLAYFNAHENWITRCFQIEYAIWFQVLLGGWQRLGLPIPLGGTSVYFRRSALIELGGWDAHNVTEDADLGIRLARQGLKTAVLGSVTEEEANGRTMPWIRQRSRWLKGYMMTWLCHMRAPRRLWRDLGAAGFLGFHVLFLGGVVSYLAMPLFWAALAASLLAGQQLWGPLMPGWAALALGTSLVFGQAVMLGAAFLALSRRRALGLAFWVPSLLVYWTLGAAAAWKALVELAAAPYYWDKTRHGLSQFVDGRTQISRRSGRRSIYTVRWPARSESPSTAPAQPVSARAAKRPGTASTGAEPKSM